MKNIVTYIKEYGKYDFNEMPVNDIDHLIFSQFSYLKMENLVPLVGTDDGMVCIKELMDRPNYMDLYADKRHLKENMELFESMANSVRFGKMKVGHHINLISKRWEMQFSAVCCEMPNGETSVVFRGTDETFVGWKEDFNMGFETPIRSQLKAVDYINYVAERISGDFTVCGHSKGGNLAVYSAMKCPAVTRERIKRIYSFDGPGFTKEALSDGSFELIKDRVRKIVPYASVVGMLLQNQEEYHVVECTSIGLLQHNPFNWIVEEDDFNYLEDVKKSYQIQNESIQKWVEDTSPEEMKVFVDEIYSVFEAIGVDNLIDIRGNYAEMLKNFTAAIEKIDDKHKEIIKVVFKNLFTTYVSTVMGHNQKIGNKKPKKK